MQGIVIAKNADLFSVQKGEEVIKIKPSGKTKTPGIFVGDVVEYNDVITGVLPRKNLLIRPPLANVDKMLIVISSSPRADLTLLDKMLIYCKLNDIEPVIVINKIDICPTSFIENIEKIYKNYYKIIKISAKNKNIDDLAKEIDGLTVLAGQSAVGKSSIINALFEGKFNVEVGELSKKTERGKQTTRLVRLFKYKKGYIADTAGFSLLNLAMISTLEEGELGRYFPEFLSAIEKCKYRSCLHEGGDCGVILYVNNGKISKERYQSYLKILQELKNSKKF